MKSVVDTTKQPRRRTVFGKILTGYIVLTVLIVVVSALVSFFLVSRDSIRTNLNTLGSNANTIASMIGRPGGTSWVLSSGRREEILALADASLTVVYPDMSIKQFVPTVWPGGEGADEDIRQLDLRESLDIEVFQQLLSGETVSDVRRFDYMAGEVLFAGSPVLRPDGSVSCGVLLYKPLKRVSDSIATTVFMFLAAGVLAVLVAMVLALIIGRRLTNPLVEMNRTAARIAAGNYGEQVEIHTDDEIAEVGHMLNTVSTKLATVIRNLDNEKHKLEQVLASLGDGVVAIDRDGQVVHYNAASLELLGIEDNSGPYTERQLQILQMMKNSMETHTRNELSETIEGRALNVFCSPILTDDGGASGAVCLIHDASEAHRLEQMRRDFVADISHELRTPLTGIRGMVEPLMDGYIDTEEEKQDCYRIIHQEALRMERLVHEMLDLSRLRAERMTIDVEPMDAVALVQAACRRLSGMAQEAQVELRLDCDDELIVMGNEDRIIQVLIILLDNAISYTRPGGSVTLGARRTPDGWAKISVADTGEGIADEDLPYIWERFYKADRSRVGKKGIGLGLPIARLVVELMGGEITVKTRVGEGTVFTFVIPTPPGDETKG